MGEVSIRELRNHGGHVIDRVAAGERLTVTRGGKAVAELRPLTPRLITAEALLERWARIPKLDRESLRRDLDAIIDPTL